jgi:DNA-binding NarL/FixJ family response regulator
MKRNTKVAIVDDHVLLRTGLANLLMDFGYLVLCEHSSGRELRYSLDIENLPDIVLIDIALPQDDAYETTLWLRELFPAVTVVALGMYVNEKAITRIITNGATDYILKDIDPYELKRRLNHLLK